MVQISVSLDSNPPLSSSLLLRSTAAAARFVRPSHLAGEGTEEEGEGGAGFGEDEDDGK